MTVYTRTAGKWRVLRQRTAMLAQSPIQLAEKVLCEFGIVQPPIDVENLIAQLDVKLQRVGSAAWSGAVNSNQYSAVIWIRSTDATARQRFTMAHELGHLLLHEEGIVFRDDTFSGNFKETEANLFAATLLMPRQMVGAAYQASRDGKVLADKFGVSESAMRYRLNNLFSVPLPYT